MKPKSALFFLLFPLLSLGAMSINPAQAQRRTSCPHAQIYIGASPPVETSAICQAARPLAAEGLSVVIFVTDSAGSLQSSSWDTEQRRVKHDSGLQRRFETDFAPDGLFLAVRSGRRSVSTNSVVVVPTLGENLYNSPAEANRIIRVITREIEAGLRNDTLTEGLVTALGKTHRLLYGPRLALMLSIALPTGVIIILGGVLLYRQRNQLSPSPQQLEQIQHLLSTLPDSRSAEVGSCEQTRQWVKDITRRPERYTLGLREMVRFVEVEVTQKRGFLNFCRRLWRRGRPRFPEPELQGSEGQDAASELDAAALSQDKSEHLLTSSTPEPAPEVDTMQIGPEQVIQNDATASLDDVGVEARQRIALIQQLIDQKHYLPALEVWKQAQIELVQFAIAQLQQRRQAAEAHYSERQHKSEYILRDREKYSQYMEAIAQRLETGNINELLKLQRDLVSLLYFVKCMERSADRNLRMKKDAQWRDKWVSRRGGRRGGQMSSKDVDRLVSSIFDSGRSSGSSSSWRSGSSSSWGSSSRSSSRGSSRRSSSRGSSRRSSSRGSSRRR